MEKTVYYLPGRGGQLSTGLGKGLADRGLPVLGRETLGQFLKLTFQQQIDTIKSDLNDLTTTFSVSEVLRSHPVYKDICSW